jgi:alkanesulfonate monooxygenase SsuD/methylene tetrahydromethanopterin reductase-like flavin-dependent oxidoreductase (luciferase family)
MKRSFVFADSNELEPVLELAALAETNGFYRVWTTETPWRDAILRATAIALRTNRINIGTGIAYTFSRAPLNMAAAAAEVQLLSHGRFALGIGSGTRGMRRHWYGLEMDRPAPRMEEYVRFLKSALASDHGFRFEGTFYTADVPAFHIPGDRNMVESTAVYGSGVNPTMLQACLKVCDGIALHPLSAALPYFDSVVKPALERVNRQVRLAAWRITAVAQDGEVAREMARRNIAFYLSTPSYRGVAMGRPWENLPLKVQEAFRAAPKPVDWRPIAELVGDDALHELTLAGTPDEVRAGALELEDELERRGIDEIVFQPAAGSGELDSLRNQHLIIDTLSRNPKTE